LSPENAEELFSQYDIILDASDNPKARYLINDAAIILKVFYILLMFLETSSFGISSWMGRPNKCLRLLRRPLLPMFIP
jgi:molybdopterin/thiamine biosynthesis adenylyltransferase